MSPLNEVVFRLVESSNVRGKQQFTNRQPQGMADYLRRQHYEPLTGKPLSDPGTMHKFDIIRKSISFQGSSMGDNQFLG